jgi:hypothetical protein
MLFYGKDWYNDIRVQEMDYAEQGMYLLLCWLCWSEGSIPDDGERIARILRVEAGPFVDKSFSRIRACFNAVDGRLIHGKVEEIRTEVDEFSQRQRDRANRRWHKDAPTDAETMPDACGNDAIKDATDDAETMPPISDLHLRSPSSSENQNHCAFDKARVDENSFSLIPKTEKPIDPRHGWFTDFWEVYRPLRSRARADALKAFLKIVTTESIFNTVMDALAVQSPEMRSREPDKRPYAATWLRGRRFDDELTAEAAPVSEIDAAIERSRERGRL